MNELEKAELRKLDLQAEQLELENWRIKRENSLIQKSPIAAGEFAYVGAVMEGRVHELMERLTIWANNHPEAPITLTINSQGGTVIDGFALFDFLQRLKKKGHHITTVGLGLVASMGAVLLQAGDERIMSPRTWMLIHQVQGVAEGSFSEMKNTVKFNERLQNQALDILAKKAKWSKAVIKNRWKEDCWLDAADALKAGLIDRIEDV